jgi:hypothetical protein
MKPKLIYKKRAGWHIPDRKCPNCNEVLLRNGHYVPPSLGEPGFFICTPTPIDFTTSNVNAFDI